MVNRAKAGISAGILGIIIAVVVAILAIAIAVGVYHVGYSSLGAMGTVTGSASIIGAQGMGISLSASGGGVTIQSIIIYGPSGNVLLQLPGSTLPTGCTLTIYNSSGTFTSWGNQVLQAGQSSTINLVGTCGLGTATTLQVVYNNGKSITLTAGS